jgi:hypothetical protein
MDNTNYWIKEELLQLFYSVVDDYKAGIIPEEQFKERLLRLAERYERTLGKSVMSTDQKDLF